VTVNESKIRLWNIEDQGVTGTLTGHMQKPRDIISDGKLCACSDGSETIYVWDVSAADAAVKLLQADGPVDRIFFGPGNSSIIALLASGTVSEFNFTLEAPLAVLPTRSDVSLARKFSNAFAVSANLLVACGQLPAGLKFRSAFAPEEAPATPTAPEAAAKVSASVAVVATSAKAAESLDANTQMQVEEQAVVSERNIANEIKGRVSMAPLIKQALASKDKKLLDQVISNAIRSTIATSTRELAPADVAGFLEHLIEVFERHPANIKIVSVWVTHLLNSHSSLIMSQHRLRSRLEPLHAGIAGRVGTYEALLKLNGRLAAVISSCSTTTVAAPVALEPLVRWRDT